MSELHFSSKEELYTRVKPALRAKIAELHRLGYTYVQEVDIWNYLIKTKWMKAKNLSLSDVVSDILHAEDEEIDIYLKGEIARQKRRAHFHRKLEIV